MLAFGFEPMKKDINQFRNALLPSNKKVDYIEPRLACVLSCALSLIINCAAIR